MQSQQVKNAKVLYLFSRSRLAYRLANTDLPDTQLFGLNHLPEYGLGATSLEISDLCLGRLLGKLLGRRWRYGLLFFWTRGYQLTFGPSLIYQMPLKAALGSHSRYVLLNINLNSMLDKYERNAWLYTVLKRNTLRFDGIVCLSEYQRTALVCKHGIPKQLTTVVPLGVDIDFYPYVGALDRQDFILSVGRDKGRDYATLIAVARLMPDNHFVIVCSASNIKAIKDIPKNVKIVHDLSPVELRELYRKACLGVLPTYGDHSGVGMDCSGQTVLLDMMASGVPIIATERRYLDDYACAGEEIVVVPSGNPVVLSQALSELIRCPETRTRLARAARARVEGQFTSRLMAGKLAGYFNHILQS